MRGGPPPGRGKPPYRERVLNRQGWTPAWAGQTIWVERLGQLFWVDPRLGGANAASYGDDATRKGGPPPGRGKLVMESSYRVGARWTPAWAGQTNPSAGTGRSRRVDPRLGGANVLRFHVPQELQGGPPPGRGKPDRLAGGNQERGWTPAWAGQTVPESAGIRPNPVDPRLGGANQKRWSSMSAGLGGPPPGRGKPTPGLRQRAKVGWTPPGRGKRPEARVPVPVARWTPPGRGKRHNAPIPRDPGGWTPAWAGQTSCRRGPGAGP